MKLSQSVFALTGRPPHLPFFALTHVLRTCHYPYPADCPSSLDGSSPGHASLHHLLSGSAVSVGPSLDLEGIVSRCSSILFTLRPARWLERLPSPRRRFRVRQARPFTAELAPARVSPDQSLLSLLGPTTYCRGGIRTRSRIKERRLHQKVTKVTKSRPILRFLIRFPKLFIRRRGARQRLTRRSRR
jgi:hypothetical protein